MMVYRLYVEFHIIVCGLDSIIARRWINGMVVCIDYIIMMSSIKCCFFLKLSLLKYDENDELDQTSIIPLIDGGTEGIEINASMIHTCTMSCDPIGFKGNARVVLPGISACIDCTLDLYPPQVSQVSKPLPYLSSFPSPHHHFSLNRSTIHYVQ